MDRETRRRRDRLILEARDELRRRNGGTIPTARQIDADLGHRDPAHYALWTKVQDQSHRISTILQVIRDDRRGHSEARPIRPPKKDTRGIPYSPVWFVGPHQRNDLRPDYEPVLDNHTGAFIPDVLNRGSQWVRQIRVRIGKDLELIGDDILPSRRAKLRLADGGSSFVYVAALFGGNLELEDARFSDKPVRTYRYEVRLNCSYGERREIGLAGDLVGDARRGFFRFKPRTGRATPLY